MNTGGEAGEQIVRMSLNGVEVAARITGAGAKQLAILLYTILKEQNKTKGAARLSSMLRSGKELKVFTVKQSDLKIFAKEAKRYGILYCALKGIKKNPDGMVDIMVRAEDASKINRIVERFELATVDKASIKNEILKNREKSSESKGKTEQRVGLTQEENQQAETLLDELLGIGIQQTTEKDEKPDKTSRERKTNKKELSRLGEQEGQTNARLSEPILKKQSNKGRISMDRSGERRSVRADIAKIRQERGQAENKKMPERKPDRQYRNVQKDVTHWQPEKKKRRKGKER